MAGRTDEVNIIINGTIFDSYQNLKIEKRLNEVDTFEFTAFITDDTERGLISEGQDIQVFEDQEFLFKGRIENTNYDSSFKVTVEGEGMANKLLDRKTKREEFNNERANVIATTILPTDTVSEGTIEEAPITSLRFDHDNIARAIAGAANSVGFDWTVTQEADDDYETDYLDFVERKGSATPVETYTIGDNARLVEEEAEDGFVANDITLLGRGDGVNQLEARVYAAADDFTQLTAEVAEDETDTFTVDDTSVIGSTGDTVVVKVGAELIEADIVDNTTLEINSRGLTNFDGDETPQILHRDNISVWLYENITQETGPFTPENQSSAQTGSSINDRGVKQLRETDKTITALPTLEQVADRELRNRYREVQSIRIRPSDPRVGTAVELGDEISVEGDLGTDLTGDFRVVGIDANRRSAEEGTEFICATRPRRLVERLSEIERDRDTLNAHMQGATNFNGEHFEDNCDNTHPLTNKVFVPEDVVKINKFELTFARESFRGYVQNQEHSHSFEVTHPSHSHDVEIDIPDHDHSVSIDIPDHDHEIDLTNSFIQLTDIEGASSDAYTVAPLGDSFDEANLEITGSPDTIETGGIVTGDAGSAHTHDWPSDTESTGTGDIEINLLDITGKMRWPDVDSSGSIPGNPGFIGNIYADTDENNVVSEDGGGEFISTTTQDGGSEFITETSDAALGTTNSETSDDAGSPDYGIFEPNTEPDVDVEVYVDGTLVETVTGVGVGDEIDTPISLIEDLSDPLTGAYHEIELKPMEADGSNNGRSRLAADVTEKVFIESTL